MRNFKSLAFIAIERRPARQLAARHVKLNEAPVVETYRRHQAAPVGRHHATSAQSKPAPPIR